MTTEIDRFYRLINVRRDAATNYAVGKVDEKISKLASNLDISLFPIESESNDTVPENKQQVIDLHLLAHTLTIAGRLRVLTGIQIEDGGILTIDEGGVVRI